ncbi:L-lysine 6-transaminase [Pedosphaera parvula]|uniref:L-lysine-epsilon aminotransferase n=1 Tax=Pedosphaera parvula (strain Ellin514) TaxID=320771 RepID=B9XL44_PEDPL|nr:L-lysine 6-transaminase [Pedosphaera parvula]EEF59395.1 L-lysine 6-transaminase [Pedosphaera parvula Ellin514]
MPTIEKFSSKETGSKPAAKIRGTIAARDVIAELEKHILVDGFKIVIDLEKSRGSILVDAPSGREIVDLYSFYASTPVGYNHPYLSRPDVEADLLAAAKIKVANADMYSVQYATFVDTFARVMPLPPLNRFFFIEGGALAVENALKAAMDWKVRKNLAAGLGERGTEIIHFERAFHGRTGYTMSLTNTDPKKVQYFAKFPWPRISSPYIDYSLPAAQRAQAAAEKEKLAEKQIREVIAQKGPDIAAIIIEPVQGEGGDNHFRTEWFKTLRSICDENDILLIFDEVQTGMGLTGKGWCCEHFGVMPDLLSFGKKAQVCGIMAGPRLDEVKENVFRVPSRINSTWGGNFTDFVRSTHFLRIIEEEKLVENARLKGELFQSELQNLARKHPVISAVRGRGLMLAFDLPNGTMRDAFWKGSYELGLLVVRCGDRSIRLRPVLDVKEDTIEAALRIMDGECRRLNT